MASDACFSPQMDIWEANSIAGAYTPHVCTKNGPYRCEGTECGAGDGGRGRGWLHVAIDMDIRIRRHTHTHTYISK